jgi:one-component system sensor histidine kinase/response regulator
METDMWILATSSSLADADLPWISPIAIAVAVLLIITAAYFVFKAHIDKKLTKEREAMIRSQQEQELKTAQNKIRFLTNVSQQLFTPLTLIYAPVNELLRRTRDSRDPVPTHDAYCLSEIERNSLRLIRLIEQQLDYEKLDQGQLTLQIGPSDIIPRIRNVINGFNRISGEKNIDIHLDCPYDSLVLPVDSDKLEKIAANLIGHTLRNIRPNATVWIELRVTVEPDSIFGLEGIHDKYLQINVIDNGSLLSEENLSHLFERYRRADKEEIQNEFGIDLHYVKKLTELHGGRVIARRRQTEGTVYSVILPADRYDKSSHPNSAPDSSLPALNPPQPPAEDDREGKTPDRTILVAVDDPELGLFLRTILMQSCRIVTATDGQQAYEKAEEIRPNLIVCDLSPASRMFDLCRKMKGNDHTARIPVILLLSQTETDGQIAGYDSGADICLPKPFKAELLASIVENRLEKELQKEKISQTVAEEKPESPDRNDLHPLDQKFMEKLYKFIEENLSDQDLSVNTLGKNLGFGRTSFYRKIKQLTGQTPNDFLRIYRLNRSAELIREGQFPLNEIAEMTGFGTHSHFSTCFKKHFGISPRNFK